MHELAGVLNHEYGTQINITVKKGVDDCTLSMKERLEFKLICKKSLWLMTIYMYAAAIDIALQRIDKDLVMTIAATVVAASHAESKLTAALDEIKKRADAIHWLLDVAKQASRTTVIAVIKK